MVDREARNTAAEALRTFVAGSISNKEYERWYPRSTVDAALWEIYVQVWFLYSDVRTHALVGKYALDDDQRAVIERCILFLRSNAEYEWPRQRFRPLYGILQILGLKRNMKPWEDGETGVGDKEVWPFHKKEQYQQILHQ